MRGVLGHRIVIILPKRIRLHLIQLIVKLSLPAKGHSNRIRDLLVMFRDPRCHILSGSLPLDYYPTTTRRILIGPVTLGDLDHLVEAVAVEFPLNAEKIAASAYDPL